MYSLDAPVSVAEPTAISVEVPRWRLSTRIAFRFCVLYFGLYVVLNLFPAVLVPLSIDMPNLGDMGVIQRLVKWVARVVFGVSAPLVVTVTGSGDRTYDWVLACCLLVAAALGTATWSVVDRRHGACRGAHAWFHLFLRFSLGSTLASYGLVKVVPLQMPAPSLTRLLEPFGHFSPMGVLWASIGASRPYEIFTGCAELTAAVLLFVPRTATLGALVALGVTSQVFVLNMTYDVPVKLFSFHLMAMSLALLAPDMRRLAAVFLSAGPAGPSALAPLAVSQRRRRIATAAQILVAGYILVTNAYGARQAWFEYGGGAPKSPLYGIWTIEHMTIDSVERAPLVTDYDRWRRAIFDRPTFLTFQRMNDTFSHYGATIDGAAKTIVLKRGAQQEEAGRFTFERPAADRLTLDGRVAGRAIRMRLALVDRQGFLLVSRGFNWVQEYPFNR
jgi:hypothetical protein